MGIPISPRRRTTTLSNNRRKKQSVYFRGSTAPTSPAPAASKDVRTPRTLERKTMQKESVANLFSELKLNPGPFCLHHIKSAQKDWKLRAAALQSTQARRICRNLQKRKQLVRTFTLNAGFGDIFKTKTWCMVAVGTSILMPRNASHFTAKGASQPKEFRAF